MARPANQLRIIAGKWRGRKLVFPNIDGLRPTPDRIRETVFNWLMPYLDGANCLDAFAGSGALGFEALSRGAKAVTMLDNNNKVIQQLGESAKQLNAEEITLINSAVSTDTCQLALAPFDIVFLDPPYRKNLVPSALRWLMANNYVRSGSVIYVEMESPLEQLDLPDQWSLLRSKHTATIYYGLLLVLLPHTMVKQPFAE